MPPDHVHLSAPADVVAALASPALVPPAWPGAPGGATAALRESMARFSGPADHTARRAAVVEAVAAIDVGRADLVAADVTRRRLDEGVLDAVELARTVPTETLATCLGVTRAAAGVIDDVEAMVRVIGRGEAVSPETDDAVGRLRRDVAHLGADPVPWLSLLYQDFDATAALVTTALHARSSGRPAVPAVPRTRRVATTETVVHDHAIATGTDVIIEIGAAGMPFGAGPHRCPGEALAARIAAGIARALDLTGIHVDADHVAVDGDGRPTALPLVRPGRRQARDVR